MRFLRISAMFVLLIANCFAVPNFFGHTVHPRKVNNFSALNRMLSSLPFQPRMDLMPSAGQRVNHVVKSS
ncbi:unnamed protein product [Auanema sp. JU1783]|nr:unnamed protein product [Auanema sp. JU1783]